MHVHGMEDTRKHSRVEAPLLLLSGCGEAPHNLGGCPMLRSLATGLTSGKREAHNAREFYLGAAVGTAINFYSRNVALFTGKWWS